MWFVSCSGLTWGTVCAMFIHQTVYPYKDAIVASIPMGTAVVTFIWRTAGVQFIKEVI